MNRTFEAKLSSNKDILEGWRILRKIVETMRKAREACPPNFESFAEEPRR